MITLYQLHWSHFVEKGSEGEASSEDIPSVAVARNDQQAIGRWPLVRGALWYLELKATCGLKRLAYH
jgi:hypothetical protein